MAKSTSLDEQYRLTADLAQLRNRQASRIQTDRDLDLATEALRAHLTPVATFTRTSSATDHLGDTQGHLSALERQARQVLGELSSAEWNDLEGVARAMGQEDSPGPGAMVDLSGEWADTPSGPEIFARICDQAGVDVDQANEADAFGEILDAYEAGYEGRTASRKATGSGPGWYVIQRGTFVRGPGPFDTEDQAQAVADDLNSQYGTNDYMPSMQSIGTKATGSRKTSLASDTQPTVIRQNPKQATADEDYDRYSSSFINQGMIPMSRADWDRVHAEEPPVDYALHMDQGPSHQSASRLPHSIAQSMAAQASKWYMATDFAVRANRDEYAIQAQGQADLASSAHDPHADAAADAFMAKAMHLNRPDTFKVGASIPMAATTDGGGSAPVWQCCSLTPAQEATEPRSGLLWSGGRHRGSGCTTAVGTAC